MAQARPQIKPEPLDSSRPDGPSGADNVYQSLQKLLDQRGWTQGRCSKGRLTIDAAVDELLRTRSHDPAAGAELARAARITRHLRELSGAVTLASWNDSADRRLDDVRELLTLAGRAYPTD